MRTLIALLLLAGSMTALADCPDPIPDDTICLEWIAPTQNADGTPLTNLDGYRAYWHLAGGSYSTFIDIPDEGLTEFTTPGTAINIPSPGPNGGDVLVNFVLTAYDTSDNESVFSNEVIKKRERFFE